MQRVKSIAGVAALAAVWAGAAPAQQAAQEPAAEQQVERQQAPGAARNPLLINVQQRGALRQIDAGNLRQAPDAGGRQAVFHAPFDGRLTARAVQRAIDDAVLFLRNEQATDGSIEELYRRGGGTALAALALLAAGADPVSDETLKRALEWLLKEDMDETYVRGVRANVWEYALRKCPYDERFRKALQADYEWLMKALGEKEGWRYNMASPDWDNSVTQYGVLGVWAACRAGVQPGDAFWQRMSTHFLKCQNSDGGWGYTTGGSSANMATAGLATMFLVFDMYHGRSFYSRENPRPFAGGDGAKCLLAIDHCMKWLGDNGGGNDDAYYLYGIERTGVASGRRLIGGRDWFREGALSALGCQQPYGAIMTPAGHGGARIRTAFATLFLVYGGAPVAFNKLEYGKHQEWNLNPRDLANLTRHLWAAYERPLNWSVVSIAAPVEEFEAPILFVSGSRRVEFADEQVARLRAYVERGGLILAEPSDGSAEFRESMIALVRRMYPESEYPGRGLEPLPADHGLYTVLRQDWQKRPRLHGASDGARTFFLLSDEYLSADWQTNRTESDAFRLAMNLLFYATDMGELDGRFATDLPETEPARERATVATVATAKHGLAGAQPGDWRAGTAGWERFAPYFRHVSGATLKVREPVALGVDALDGVHVLRLSGRHALDLTAAEQQALRDYVAAGGTLLVDAYAGAASFAKSARERLTAMFGDLQPLAGDHVLAAGRFLGGADLSRSVRFTLSARRALRARGEDTRGQKLMAVFRDGRPAVLFSEFDLTAAAAGIANYGAAGYKPDSARRVLANIVAYVCAD